MEFTPKDPVGHTRVIKWCVARGNRAAYKYKFMSYFINKNKIKYELYKNGKYRVYIVYSDDENIKNKFLEMTVLIFNECFIDFHMKKLLLADNKSIENISDARKR